MPEVSRAIDTCVSCEGPGSKRCVRCHSVTYCGKQCQTKDWARHKRLCVPVVIVEIQGKGRGLVASKDFKMGDLIIRDKAAVTIADGTPPIHYGLQIKRQLENLSEEERGEFYKLTRNNVLKPALETDIGIQFFTEIAIFANNQIEGHGADKCLFISLSLLNHSCASNASWTSDISNPLIMEVRAIGDIKKGEEITVNYLCDYSVYLSNKERADSLMTTWNFRCDCPPCTSGNEEVVKGNIRILRSDLRSLYLNPDPSEVYWKRLTKVHEAIVDNVLQLSCAPLMAPVECKFLANSAHLARKSEKVKKAMDIWKDVVVKRKVEEHLQMYENHEKLLNKWKKYLDKKKIPAMDEINIFFQQ